MTLGTEAILFKRDANDLVGHNSHRGRGIRGLDTDATNQRGNKTLLDEISGGVV